MNAHQYRELAMAARSAAERETLPRCRAQHERTAEIWEGMALDADATAQLAAANREERQLRPYHQTLRASSRMKANNARRPR